MADQLTLKGFEIPHTAGDDDPGMYRRQSDLPGGSAGDVTGAPEGRTPHGQKGAPLVSVYTLGRFSLLLKGVPAEFGRKTPRRPLELLKAIVAFGGRDINTAQLMSALWPDVDGDSAQRSFDTTLHRLRKLIGDDRVLTLNDGKLSLDGRYCWVDVWSFERLLGQSHRLLTSDVTGLQVNKLEQLTGSLIGLYQDQFLANENITSWSVSLHERLRNKYIHHLLEVGRYMERHRHWNQAMQCYRTGTDVDDLVEVFYQRLMHCCLQTYRFSEGMAAYRRCRQVLSVSLGLQPEPETESLYQSLRQSRLSRQSA